MTETAAEYLHKAADRLRDQTTKAAPSWPGWGAGPGVHAVFDTETGLTDLVISPELCTALAEWLDHTASDSDGRHDQIRLGFIRRPLATASAVLGREWVP